MGSQIIIFSLVNLVAAVTCDGMRGQQNVDNRQKATIEQSKMTGFMDPTVDNRASITGRSTPSTAKQHIDWTYAHGPEFAGFVIEGAFSTVHAKIRIDKPQVQAHHYSAAYIAIESARGGINFNQIQVGWMVHPDEYGDDDVHLFARWTGDNNKECFHLHCTGFVATGTTELTLGSKLEPSVIGYAPVRFLSLTLVMDHYGFWFLRGGADSSTLGYWNVSYFSSLSNQGATTVRLGGEVFTPEDSDSSPPMGSGKFQYSNNATTCFFEDVQLNYQDPQDAQHVETRCYYASEKIDREWIPEGAGFYFGGRGGRDGDTCFYP